MKIIYVNKQHQCRTITFDDPGNRFWVKPSFRERFLEKRKVGFDLDQLESIKEMPSIAEKIPSHLSLVYLLMVFKDKRQVAVGVDEQGLNAVTAALERAGQRGEDVSNSLIHAAL